MRYQKPPTARFAKPCNIKFLFALLLLIAAGNYVSAQTYRRELDTGDKVSLSVKSRSGRVSVIAQDELSKKVTIEASSTGATVDASDIHAVAKGDDVNIEVRDRRDNNRIDLIVRVPSRSRVKVEGEAGSVDIVGNVESAEVTTNTGTIHADVPLEAVKLDFVWSASKPRFLSDVELPKIKERAAGVFAISGKLGEKKPNKEERVQLNFLTQRGVVLLNVDPSMVPTDLKERPLTEAARAIVRSGDSQLIDAIRKVSPKMFGDYAKTLPPPEKVQLDGDMHGSKPGVIPRCSGERRRFAGNPRMAGRPVGGDRCGRR